MTLMGPRWRSRQPGDHQENPNAWGGTAGLSTSALLRPQSRVLLIDTPMMEAPTLWYLSFLFANALPASPNVPGIFHASTGSDCTVTITRYLSPTGGQVTDVYTLNHAAGNFRQPTWLPVSTVVARKLQVVVEITDQNPLRSVLWATGSATPLQTVTQDQVLEQRTIDESGGTVGNVFGYSSSVESSPAAAGAAFILDKADATRRKFFITNESDKRLAIGFGFPPAFLAVPVWTLVLDAAGGARPFYESPLDEFWGDIYAINEAGAAGHTVFSRNNMFV